MCDIGNSEITMDSQLEEDLAEALDGCDPMQFVLKDPCLAEVAEEVYNFLQEDCEASNDSDLRFEDLNDSLESPNSSVSALSGESERFEESYDLQSHIQIESIPDVPPEKSCRINKKCKCVACGRPAKGFLYYGAMVCNGCRAFFARAIKDEDYKTFACVQDCDSKSWKKCRNCRFNNLCEVGMKVPGKAVTMRALVKAKDRYFDFDCPPEDKGVVKLYLNKARDLMLATTSLTNAEKMTVEEITAWQTKLSASLIQKLIRKNMEVFTTMLDFMYHGNQVPIQVVKLIENYMTYGSQEYYVKQGSWAVIDNLKSKDRARLVAANFPLVFEFSEALKVQSHKFWDMKNEIKEYVETLVDGFSDQDEKEYLKQIHSEVNVFMRNLSYSVVTYVYNFLMQVTQKGTLNPVDTSYNTVYNLDELGLSLDKEMAEKHRHCANKISSLTNDKFDPVMMMLNIGIILYTPDTVELDDREEAERLQMMYANLLYR